MALSGTHPIQQAFQPCSVQLRVTSPGGLYFVSAQDIMKSLYLLSGPMAMPLDNLSGWSSPSRPPLPQSSLELLHPPKEPALGELTLAIEGQDGRARRLAFAHNLNSFLFSLALLCRVGQIALVWESGHELFLNSCRVSAARFHCVFSLRAGPWN